MADAISFSRGAPSVDIVDIDGLKAAAVKAFETDPAGISGYGTAIGYVPLRRWIAERHGVSEDSVLVTNGSMQADAFLFDELVQPGDDVVTENPSYDRTLLGLSERGAKITQVAIDSEGIDVAQLQAALEAGLKPKFAHIISNFQNPGGCSLSLDRRKQLLELSDAHNFTIFEDDPYVDVRFSGERHPTMMELELQSKGTLDRVVYACSFSKTVCPGVRVGYLIANPQLISKIQRRATNTYIAPSQVAQAIVYNFVTSDRFEPALNTVKTALAERVEVLSNELRSQIPEAEFVKPEGGYFLWITLPAGIDTDLVAAEADKLGVQVVKGSDFVLDGGKSSLRLAYSAVKASDIPEGVKRLKAAIDAVA